jgi:hypothetical protein
MPQTLQPVLQPGQGSPGGEPRRQALSTFALWLLATHLSNGAHRNAENDELDGVWVHSILELQVHVAHCRPTSNSRTMQC